MPVSAEYIKIAHAGLIWEKCGAIAPETINESGVPAGTEGPVLLRTKPEPFLCSCREQNWDTDLLHNVPLSAKAKAFVMTYGWGALTTIVAFLGKFLDIVKFTFSEISASVNNCEGRSDAFIEIYCATALETEELSPHDDKFDPFQSKEAQSLIRK